MKKVLLATIVATSYLLSFSQDSTVFKLEELMHGYYASGKFNGTVLVAKKGNILLHKGYGIQDAQNKLLNNSETVYQTASITKSFTSAVVLKLVELKKISLADKLSKFYPGFDKDITIEHLLHHTSGITNITETEVDIPGAHEKKMIEYLQKLKLDFAPGTSWHYSNSGYIILGYIIAKVSGKSYWEAVRKYIFKPLDMKNSGFDFIHLAKKEKATGYNTVNDAEAIPSIIADSTGPHAAGAIYSTVGDLYKFHIGLQNYTVVSKKLMDKAYEPSLKNNYGYGWQIDSIFGHKMVSHSGSIHGFGSNFARITNDNICIVVLSNRFQSTFEAVNITQQLVAVLYGQPYKVPVKRTPFAVDEQTLKLYEGVYEFKERNLVIDMNIENGKLVARPHNGPHSPMMALEKNRFISETDDKLEIIFQFDENGKVNQFILNHGDRKAIIKRIK